jgi:hypothetical protein
VIGDAIMASRAVRYSCVLTAVVIAVVLGGATAAAQTPPADIEFWPSLSVSAPIRNWWEVRADGLLQVTGNASRISRELARVVVIGKINDRLAVGGGYTWTCVDDREGRQSVEHRAVQEVDLRIAGDTSAIILSSRTRLEERRREQEPAIAVRLRQQTRLDLPLGNRAIRAVVWNEYFHALNATDWSGRSGPRLMLNFAGLHMPIARKIAIEPGYLNQTDFVAGRNQLHHVVALFLIMRL